MKIKPLIFEKTELCRMARVQSREDLYPPMTPRPFASSLERGKLRDEAKLSQLTSDPHSPDAERTQTVRNMDAWYTAFGAQPGDKLYLAPADRVKIW
jgi:hypothetical protein